MKILFVHPLNIDYPGGGERFIVEVSKRLRLRNHIVGVLYVDWAPHEPVATQNSHELLRYGVKMYKCNYLKLPRGFPLVDPSCTLYLSKQFDLIYMSACPPNELVMYSLKKLGALSKPVIAVFHAMIEPHKDMLHKLYLTPFITAYKEFNKLHVLNRYTLNFFVRHYGINERKVVFIPNGVDTAFYRLITKYFEQNNKFVVLFVSRLTMEKGIDILYEVVSRFNERYSELRSTVIFKVAGTGPLLHYIEKLVNKYDNVVYLGYLSKEQLLMEYNSAHVLIMTSRMENMPLTLLEASACGLPAIASAVPGIVDVIKTVGYGILVRPGDFEGFVRGIISLYKLWREDLEKYYSIRQTIRERTITNFSWDVIVNRIENMFKEVVLENRSSKG
jgi:glycosyltransferase involved in cell wall biosynthesis